MTWTKAPFVMRRYPWRKAIGFLSGAGWGLWAWGFCLPLTRHGGLVVAWMRKEQVCIHDMSLNETCPKCDDVQPVKQATNSEQQVSESEGK